MDIIKHLREMLNERGWSEYRLAKEASLPQSTIANIFHRNTLPSIPTLTTICNAFGITLSQFFAESECVSLTKEQRDVLADWENLNPEQKAILKQLMRELAAKRG